MILAKEQRIGAIILFGIAIIAWIVMALYPSTPPAPETPKKKSWAERKDSIRLADSLRYVQWREEREQRYDSFRMADSLRHEAWKIERQHRWDSMRIAELDLPGYAIGGLAVGETHQEMYDTIEAVEEHMPKDKPRYLMGVGTPGNIIEGVARGVDFFDCVMPARNGRHGHLFTWDGIINIKNQKYEADETPIDRRCGCPVCRRYSKAYLRHLFKAEEMLAMRLSVAHNLFFYTELAARIRTSIEDGGFESFRREYSKKLDIRI